MTDDQAVPPPADAIDMGFLSLPGEIQDEITANIASARIPLGHHDLGCQCWPHYSRAELDAAYAAGAAQALADAHLVPDTLIAEAIHDEREACARLAEQHAQPGSVAFWPSDRHVLRRFADLLRQDGQP